MYHSNKRLLYVLSGLLVAELISETIVLGIIAAHETSEEASEIKLD